MIADAGPPQEIELKLEGPPEGIARLKRELERNGQSRRRRSSKLESVYFDTAARDLQKAGLTLRVRRSGGRRVQTIKVDQPSTGLFERSEWECDIDGPGPDYAAAAATALGPLLTKGLQEAIRPAFRTSVARTEYELGDGDWRVSLALDEGRVVAGRRSLPLSEVELELEQGQPARLFDLARDLERRAPLRLGVRSKAERGYALILGNEASPVHAEKLKLRRGLSSADAFRMCARACLRQLIANEPAVLRGDAEGVHQMRVGLRRLRAALSLWKGMVADARLTAIKSELKWMTAELGPARSLDVFAHELVAPAQERHADDSGLSALLAEAARQRAQALERVQEAVCSSRFRRMCLETAAWIEAGPWTVKDGARAQEMRSRPVEAHAAGELARRARKIRKRGRKLAQLDPRRRHRLRIAVKKIRYAVDFFAALFADGRAKRRRKRFVAALKRLQSGLGQLNDIAGTGTLGRDLVFGAARRVNERTRSRRAFAAGMVTGLQEARVAPLLHAAEASVDDFREVKTFWT